jgi:hypothetical protein
LGWCRAAVEMQRRLTNGTSLFNKVDGPGGVEAKFLVTGLDGRERVRQFVYAGRRQASVEPGILRRCARPSRHELAGSRNLPVGTASRCVWLASLLDLPTA